MSAPIPIGGHELNERLQVFREVLAEDDLGGTSSALTRMRDVRAKVSQPAAAEQVEAMQAGSSLTMIVHMRPDADVRRGDLLKRKRGEVLRVKYTIAPSEPVYLRADCEQIQYEGELA